MGELTRQILSEQAVCQEQSADDHQRRAHRSTHGFEQRQHDNDADNDIGGVWVATALDDLCLEDPVIETQCEAAEREQPIVKGDAFELPARLPGRVKQEGDQQQEADMDRPRRQGRQWILRRHHQLKGGKQQRRTGDDQARQAAEPTFGAVFLEPRRLIFLMMQ